MPTIEIQKNITDIDAPIEDNGSEVFNRFLKARKIDPRLFPSITEFVYYYQAFNHGMESEELYDQRQTFKALEEKWRGTLTEAEIHSVITNGYLFVVLQEKGMSNLIHVD